MQPRTTRPLDEASFTRIRRELQDTLEISRRAKQQPDYATELPLEVGFQLTNRCNLRCVTCFQWNESGFHTHATHAMQNAELSIEVFHKVMRETRPVRSSIYLWGGEPLVYRKWDEIVDTLAQDRRRVILCTNGISLPSKLDSLLSISKDLVCLISVDGFAAENDSLRGKNSFAAACRSIAAVVQAKQQGFYQGDVGISCVINGALIPQLHEFVEFCQSTGVDAVYLVFPWYIPDKTALRMDEYFATNFSWLRSQSPEFAPHHSSSWHSYRFHVQPEHLDELRQQIKAIYDTIWKTRVRFQPELNFDELQAFIEGSEQPAQRRERCLSVRQRLNVMPDGGVTTCKLFPEFRIGDLSNSSVSEVWHSMLAAHARSIFAQGLTPICSKCVQLYLHSA